MRATATTSTDTLDVIFSATPVEDHFGVPGSPRWTDFKDIKIESLAIEDEEVDPVSLSAEERERILELADGLAFEIEPEDDNIPEPF